MTKRRYLLFYLVAIGVFVLPFILRWLGGKYWMGWGYHNYLAPLLDQHNPAWSLWREQVGEATHPSFLNILYYWPFKLLITLIPNDYAAWLVYAYLVFALGGIFFVVYLRKLVPKISYPASLLLGLLYTSYISINQDGGFNLKLAAMVLPLVLYGLLKVYWGELLVGEKIKEKARVVFWYLLISLLILNLALVAPRAVVALLVLVAVHLLALWWWERSVRKLLRVSGWFLGTVLGALALFWPFKLARDAYLTYSVQISVPVKQAVLTYLLQPARLIFHPYPGLNVPGVVVVLAAAGLLGSLFYLGRLKRPQRLIGVLLGGLVLFYFVFLAERFLTIAALNLPYGQIFRSWRVSQYLAAFILPLWLTPIFLYNAGEDKSKRVPLAALAGVFLIGVYFLLSVVVFNQDQVYVKQQDLAPYFAVNQFLAQDWGDHKVLWVPEMGWLKPQGEDTSPKWLSKGTGQSFPEFMSAKPTYAHYYNRMTNFYTWLASGYWNSKLQKGGEVSEFLNILGVKYLVVHDDVPAYQESVQKILQNLAQSSELAKVYENEFLTVFENQAYQERIWVNAKDETVFCDAGLACLGEFLAARTPYKFTVDLADQVNERVLEKPLRVYRSAREDTQDDGEERYFDLLINRLLARAGENPGFPILWAKDYFKQQNLTACLSDTHHGLYHYYLDPKVEYDWAESFLPEACFFLLSGDQPSLKLPITLPAGNYVVLGRYLDHNRGGEFMLTSAQFRWSIASKTGTEGNRYQYFKKNLEVRQKTKPNIGMYGQKGINFINLLAFIPQEVYEKEITQLKEDLKLFSPENQGSQEEVRLSKVERVSPTLWQAELTAEKPFVLNFAERFHPAWEAEIWQGGQRLSVVGSTPSYGVINSFNINRTGEGLQIKLRYGLQEEFVEKFIWMTFVYLLAGAGTVMFFVRGREGKR